MRLSFAFLCFATALAAHDLPQPGMDREILRAHILEDWQRQRAGTETASQTMTVQTAAAVVGSSADAPQTAKAFLPFPRLDLRAADGYLYVGSNGLPDHKMMVGITAWQQQVPLPQNYFGDNAWRIPLKPVPAAQPAMVKGRFLRGAIALAVNGIPIFNPQNNRGEISCEIGELDEWGGHCGRADDYHYHVVPLHLQTQAGKGMPVAYALDGYPIYGLTEPNGEPVGKLDECHGHDTPGLGYHYHASNRYPYVIGGFHGEVVEQEGQVDPQPRAQGVREALTALRGAKITAFETVGRNGYKLSYEVSGDKRSVSYSIDADGRYPFRFDNGREGITEEVYSAGRGGRGPEGKGPGKGKRGGGKEGNEMQPPKRSETRAEPQATPQPNASLAGILDLNGDGIVTAQEYADHAKAQAVSQGVPQAQALAKARLAFSELDQNKSGQLERGEWNAPSPSAPPQRPAEMPAGSEPERSQEKPRGGRGGGGGEASFKPRADQPRSSDGKFLLTSPAVEDMKELPLEFTGDGSSATPPLAWTGAPAGTQSYALIMDHADRDGAMKWYWTLYDLPSSLSSLPKNVFGLGKVGTGFKGKPGYEPPHSKGPGAKVYVLTLYALAERPSVAGTPGREELLAAMQGKILATSSLRVVHVSKGQPEGDGLDARQEAPPPPPGPAREEVPMPATKGGPRPLDNIFAPTTKAPAGQPSAPPPGGSKKGQKGGKGGPPGLVKPSISDTLKLNVYADNWFMLYINGRLVAVDSIQFTPHNVVSVDFLPEYPMTIAVLAKDNADPKTGLEYGSSIGDGGFILKFADGTVTDATWKAKNFFHGPVGGDVSSPRVIQQPLPANWWAVDFDDSTWKAAKEYSVEEVDPKQPYFEHDFAGAKFIWSDDIALDNTVIFRTRVEKPGWTPRWNTKPDLDVTGAPRQ